jgi:Ca-activated chloride channel family protein
MFLLNSPLWLLLLILIPFIVYLTHFRVRRGGRVLLSFKLWQQKGYTIGSPFWRILSGISYILFWITVFLLILMLANPGVAQRENIYLNQGTAVMIVLDVSPSMAARDFNNDARFTIARRAINRFINSRDNNPVGLVTFGKEAAIRIPLSTNYPFFIDTLERVQLLELGDGTNIGMGLALAAMHLHDSGASRKSIILITDGDDNSNEFHPDNAIELLQSLDIPVFVVGIGSNETHKISIQHPVTGMMLTGTVSEAYNETLLSAIAQQTNGEFLKADTELVFDNLFHIIDSRDIKESLIKLNVTVRSSRFDLLNWAIYSFIAFCFIRFIMLKEVF